MSAVLGVGRVVPVIRSAVRTIHCSLLRSVLVAELNQTVIEVEDGFNDGRVELFQQLLWHVELPQLAKKILGLLENGVYVELPLQVLRNVGAQEPE